MSDLSATTIEPLTSSTSFKNQNSNKKRWVLLVLVPFVIVVVTAIVYLMGGRYVETDNAYVKAKQILISSDVSGTIQDVLVVENQAVEAGQLLFRVNPESFALAVNKAEAELAQVRTDLASLKAGYREKQSEITLARTKLNFAEKEQKRLADLMAKHFVATVQYDAAKQNTQLAKEALHATEQELHQIAESLGGNVDAPVENHPRYQTALAQLAQAKLQLSRVETHASLAGIITKPPKPGQYITAGNTSLVLVTNKDLWIEANFPETDLTYVHVGQPVAISIDIYPDNKFKGVVDSISPATGAEFSVIPSQNATGNWVKIAQRIPVRIRLELEKDSPQLRAGLSTNVVIDTEHKRKLWGFSF